MDYIRKGHGLNTDTHKYCAKCEEVKNRDEYYKNKARKDGLVIYCKICSRARTNARQQLPEVKKRRAAAAAKRREANPEKSLEAARKYRERHREKIREKRNSPEGRKYARDYQRNRRNTDPVFKVRCNVSRMIHHGLKGSHRTNSCFEVLPYTPQQLKEHLERQFSDWMTWENYGKRWDIDHIYPQSKLPYDSLDHPNFIRCWSLDNLQPLEKIANIKKSNRILNE